MTDLDQEIAEQGKVWWETTQRPAEGTESDWRWCCSGDEETGAAMAIASQVLSNHADKAEMVYRTRVYDNPDHAGTPLVSLYKPTDARPADDPWPVGLEWPPPSGHAGADQKDDTDQVNAEPDDVAPEFTALEQLLLSLGAVKRSVPGKPGLIAFDLGQGIDVSTLPKDVQDKLNAVMTQYFQAAQEKARQDYANTLRLAGHRLSHSIASAVQECVINRPETDWYDHEDMLDAVMIDASCALFAYLKWKSMR